MLLLHEEVELIEAVFPGTIPDLKVFKGFEKSYECNAAFVLYSICHNNVISF
jgi:hypothetical protein